MQGDPRYWVIDAAQFTGPEFELHTKYTKPSAVAHAMERERVCTAVDYYDLFFRRDGFP
jgi:hypothetical protein